MVVIVLAAGQGSRFGGSTHKLAQPLADTTVLERTLGNAIASHLAVVVVTTEAFSAVARSSVAARDVVVLQGTGANDRAAYGMGHSIAAGVQAHPDAGGWIVLPGDMPLVKASTLQAVAHGLVDHAVVYAQHLGRRGHPVGFSAGLYSDLVGLTGDQGARRLIARYPAHGLEVDDPGVLIDIDTPADLDAVRAAVRPLAATALPSAVTERGVELGPVNAMGGLA